MSEKSVSHPAAKKKSIGTVSEAIKAARIERGENQQAVADHAALSKPDYAAYEANNFQWDTPQTARLKNHPKAEALCRIAIALGKPPRDWVEAAGLRYSLATDLKARKKLAESPKAFKGPSIPDGSPIYGKILADIRDEGRVEIRVGMIQDTFRKESNRFNHEFTELICKAINHSWKAEPVWCKTEIQEFSYLRRRDGHCDMVAGVLETLDRLARWSLYFVKYPGLKSPSAGAYIANRSVVLKEGVENPVTWEMIRWHDRSLYILTTEGDAGDSFLRGVCNYSDPKFVDRIESLPEQTEAAIRKRLKDLVEEQPLQKIVFFGPQDVCVSLCDESKDGLQFEMVMSDDLPVFDACIAVLHDPEWGTLLEKSIEYTVRWAADPLSDIYTDAFISRIPLKKPVGHGYAYARLYALNVPDCSKFLTMLHAKLLARIQDISSLSVDALAVTNYIVEEAFRAAKLKLPRVRSSKTGQPKVQREKAVTRKPASNQKRKPR